MATSTQALVHARAQAERGAKVLAESCLALRDGERCWIGTFDDPAAAEVIVAAVRGTGAQIDSCKFARGEPVDAALERAAHGLKGCAASVFIGESAPPSDLSIGIIRAAAKALTRHVHMPRVSVQILGSSARADPTLLGQINARLTARLRDAPLVGVSSDAGTQLDVLIDAKLPLVADRGCPVAGGWDNWPTGYVYFHPASVTGRYVADRVALGTPGEVDPTVLRRNPLRLTLANGRVTGVECADRGTRKLLESYLAGHPDAPRVGFVSLPTNYLARAEVGSATHDSLLPGLKIHLGFSDSGNTLAPFDAPVQFRLTGRKQTVKIGDEIVVEAGRLADLLVEGIDPFR